MPERLHGETEDCNESTLPSSLASHLANRGMGKIETPEVFGNTASHIIRVIISATFQANSNDQRKPKDKLLILDGRIVFRPRSTKCPSDPIGDNLLPVGGPEA